MKREFHIAFRPTDFDEIIGQPDIIASLSKLAEKNKIPHVQLYSGPSGVGKTTAARIIPKYIKCHESDIIELNAATSRGIENVRIIQQNVSRAPWKKSRLWIIDEADQLTKDSQRGLLKILEDTPDHAYFIFATTDPQRLLPTIRTRCTEFKFKAISDSDMGKLLRSTASRADFKLVSQVKEKIIEVAQGSARKALVILHQVSEIKKTKQQIKAVQGSDVQHQAIELARKLINPRCEWKDVKDIIRSLEEEPETLRRMIKGYAGSVALGGGPLTNRAIQLIDFFAQNFYDSGREGLIFACHSCCVQPKARWKK
jgi:DNA polymerase-3 subunit gamma/tau